MPANITYGQLFAFLRNFGFEEASPGTADRVFRHADSGTLLVFSLMHDEGDRVANADLVSTERFLRTKQLIAEPLTDAVRSFVKASNR
jgi:hypothetical protein